MDDSPVKVEENPDRKAGYKSWKKKYRKMRIVFDQKMHDGEELHKQEAKASATVKRLAVENDPSNVAIISRLLDILIEINNSPQIPTDKRIDLSLPPSSSDSASLPLDQNHSEQKEQAMKRLEQLLNDVPHLSYSATKETQPSIVTDLAAPDGETHPANFLSADDVDNYIYAIDAGIEAEQLLPTLAPNAHPDHHPPSNPHLKNPTSVTNWLRKHAPKIFLQDGEGSGAHDGEDADGHTGGGRKSRGGARAERGSGRASAKSRKSAGASSIARQTVERSGDVDISMDDDPEFGATPVTKGKRKRGGGGGGDDDSGYKPRGSSTRPAKKKRKSEALESTPTARKSKKDKEAASASKED
ncbi:hypothetical protein HJFPF1_04633 [Paramyrothecium foliicola]|nr:hypothetical protein HJFPF1_04633 [Paramyrothecium foliicola]